MKKHFGYWTAADKNKKLILLLSATIIFLRVLFIFIMGPMPQDAYYFFYSQHPALSYFDHPPMIAWLLRIFTLILGNNVIAVKFANSFITFLTIIIFYQLARCFLEIRQVKKGDVTFAFYTDDCYFITCLYTRCTIDLLYTSLWQLKLFFIQLLYNSQNVIGQHALEFDYVNANLSELNGKDAIFLDSDPCVLTDSKDNKPVPVLNQYFKSVTQLDPILITANGRIVRKFLVYYCACYRNNVL